MGQTPEDYHRYAQEGDRFAARALSETERSAFQKVAERWRRLEEDARAAEPDREPEAG